MSIRGYVELISPREIHGWAIDVAKPDEARTVAIMVGDDVIATVTADRYRDDLARAGVGGGAHGFIAAFSEPLPVADIAMLNAVVVCEDGSYQHLERFRHIRITPPVPLTAAADPLATIEERPASAHDEPRPVFVLGSRRSGTSAVAHGLLRFTRYSGPYEGHLFDIITPLNTVIDEFYRLKQSELERAAGWTMIRDIPIGGFAKSVHRLFAGLAASTFTTRFWLDKTPTPDMVRAAPSLLAIWPEARFIFVRRRAFENLVSQERKFPNERFGAQCEWWSGCMANWLQARKFLAGRAIEIDQQMLAHAPSEAAAMMGDLLDLDASERHHLGAFLGRARPEKTNPHPDQPMHGTPAHWDAENRATFDMICRPLFAPYGYSEDSRYFVGGDHSLRGRVL